MKTNLYVIFDKCAKIYNTPFVFINDNLALRAAIDLVSTPGTEVYNNPEDFTLFRLGEYDDTTAAITIDPDMPVLCRFHNLEINVNLNSTPTPETPDSEQQTELKEA